MTRPVQIAAPAAAEIEEATTWIQIRNPSAAHRWQWRLLAAIEGLREFPGRCLVARHESDHFGVMIGQPVYGKGVGQYRVLYTVTENAVYVLHVRHGRRQRFGEAAGGAEG